MTGTMKRLTLLFVVAMMVAVGVVSVSAQDTPPGPDGRPPVGERMGDGPIRELIDAIVAQTDLTEEDIRTQLSEGMTLAEIITAAGGDVQAIVDAVMAPAIERAEEAVIAGRITQERADEILARLEAGINDALNRELLFAGRGGAIMDRLGSLVNRALIGQAAEALNMTTREIIGELRDGASLADVLSAGGVDVDAFIADAVAEVAATLAEAVEEGRLTQAQADALLEGLEAAVTERVNSTGPWRDGGPDRPERPWRDGEGRGGGNGGDEDPTTPPGA